MTINKSDQAAIDAWAETLIPLFEGKEIRPHLQNAMRRAARRRAVASLEPVVRASAVRPQ